MQNQKASEQTSATNQPERLLDEDMLHPFASIEALKEWQSQHLKNLESQNQRPQWDNFIPQDIKDELLPTPKSIAYFLSKFNRSEQKRSKRDKQQSDETTLSQMVFGMRIKDKLKFYQISCISSSFHEEAVYILIVKPISQKLDKQFLKQQYQITKIECRRQSIQTSNVSHEMRGPLSGIQQGSLNLAIEFSKQKDTIDPNVIDRLITIIYYQSQLLLSYVNDLLDMEQIKYGVY